MPLGKTAVLRSGQVDTVEDLIDGDLVPSDNGGAPFIRVTGPQGNIRPQAIQNASRHKLGVPLETAWDGGAKKAPGRTLYQTGQTPITPNAGNGGGKAPGPMKRK